MVETNVGLGAFDVLYEMKLVPDTANWRFEGRWKGKNSVLGFMPFNKVWLTKPKETVSTQPAIDASISPVIAKDSANKNKLQLDRKVDIQKIIEVSTAEKDSIKIAVYDNGEIDHDSISVYLNDQPVLINRLITDKPLEFYLSLDKDRQFQKIKMIAEKSWYCSSQYSSNDYYYEEKKIRSTAKQ